MIDILNCFVAQIFFSVGIIFIFGLLIYLCNKIFYRNLGNLSSVVCYVTGFIGTPIHECSHALFCLLFGHKIIEIKLFQINNEDSTLGYVIHTYNKKNIYHQIGNLFIGVAPILLASALMYLLFQLLLPDAVLNMSEIIYGTSFQNVFSTLFLDFKEIVIVFFSQSSSFKWWIFVVICVFLALHMTLSIADVKGSLIGLLYFVVLLFIIDIILGLFSPSVLLTITNSFFLIGCYLFNFLSVALMISLLLLAASFIVKKVYKK